MYTIEHEFYPSDEVFVVLEETKIHKAKVIQVEADIYEKEEAFFERLQYLVLLEDSLDTATVEVDSIFSSLVEALDKVRQNFEDSPT